MKYLLLFYLIPNSSDILSSLLVALCLLPVFIFILLCFTKTNFHLVRKPCLILPQISLYTVLSSLKSDEVLPGSNLFSVSSPLLRDIAILNQALVTLEGLRVRSISVITWHLPFTRPYTLINKLCGQYFLINWQWRDCLTPNFCGNMKSIYYMKTKYKTY